MASEQGLVPGTWDHTGRAGRIPTQRHLGRAPTLRPSPHRTLPWVTLASRLTILTRLQATPVHPLLAVGALEARWAMADIGRAGIFATNAQAAVEAGSVGARHPAHLTAGPVEAPGTGTRKRAGRFLERQAGLGGSFRGAKPSPPRRGRLFAPAQAPGSSPRGLRSAPRCRFHAWNPGVGAARSARHVTLRGPHSSTPTSAVKAPLKDGLPAWRPGRPGTRGPGCPSAGVTRMRHHASPESRPGSPGSAPGDPGLPGGVGTGPRAPSGVGTGPRAPPTPGSGSSRSAELPGVVELDPGLPRR